MHHARIRARRVLILLMSVLMSAGVFPRAVESSDRATASPEEAHWAFLPPSRKAVPVVGDRHWPRNPIDAFILERIEKENLSPSPEADRTTLLRRLCFDLTGLPPSPGEVRSFLSDSSPDAYEKVVERLLASPRYGERWAQHWLDLARYADTDGFEFDQVRPDAWRYRDWVVAALNQDMTYSSFIRHQMAGDEIVPLDPMAAAATGFHRCYPDMVDLNDQGLRRQNALDDITETTGLVFLGLTIGCARCHDHKFDPIKQSDFYQLQAVFAPSRFRDDFPLATPTERRADEERRREAERSLSEIQSLILEIEHPWREFLAPGPPAGIDDETATALQGAAGERLPSQTKRIFEAFRRDRRVNPDTLRWLIHRDPLAGLLHDVSLARAMILERSLAPRLPVARVLEENGTPASTTRLLIRGNHETPGPTVAPDVPIVLREAMGGGLRITPNPRSSGRRSALANWLNQANHPLTARVMVNRVWLRHFGRGIVSTPSDFGAMGEAPTHPELLDWLAVEFVEQGGSLKALHRLMVTSATYRQSSTASPELLAADPDNLLFSRQRRQRLDGEAIRDAILSASGMLSQRIGGPSIYPELPSELTRLSSKGAAWPVSKTLEERCRRSVYVFVRRNLRYPFFEAFDRPDTNASCPERATSIIAPQALTLLNGRLANDSARAFARRLECEAGESRIERINRAFLVAFGRPPTRDDLEDCLHFLNRDRDLARLCLALLNANEFVYID